MGRINSVAVLGAGTMGAQIAAHLANVGVHTLLLDLTTDAARRGLEHARRLKPDPAFTPNAWTRITIGSFDADLPRIGESDWIVEAIVERLDIKRGLLEKVDAARRPGSIVSSNTSGIPIAALAEARSDDFRRHWLGTHFFNPPRYLHLLEVIPTPETSTEVVEAMSHFADHRLGKGVVVAKDSPAFIGNHIGLYGMMRILAAVDAGNYTIDEVDAVTGPALGRPKSATFRTLDLAGLDILGHVVGNMHEQAGQTPGHDVWTLPPFFLQMLERGLTGEKTGKGFYTRVKQAGGQSKILTIDPATLEYRERQSPRLESLAASAEIEDVHERVRTLFQGQDKVGRFLRDTLAPTLTYTAAVTPSIAHSPDDVDRVMRWGFGWELGPFELIDAIGIQRVLDATSESSPDLLEGGTPPLLQAALQGGRDAVRGSDVPPAAPDLQILRAAKERSARREEERGRQPDRSRRRRVVSRVPLEDEYRGRRHDPDAAGRRPRGLSQLLCARRR